MLCGAGPAPLWASVSVLQQQTCTSQQLSVVQVGDITGFVCRNHLLVGVHTPPNIYELSVGVMLDYHWDVLPDTKA